MNKNFFVQCASCKKVKIEDDKTFYWLDLKKFKNKHPTFNESEFSHGVCLPCAKILYPKLYEKFKNKKKEITPNE